MKPQLTLVTLLVFSSLSLLAQTVHEDPKSDPVLDAIEEFEQRDQKLSEDVQVVLDPATALQTSDSPAPIIGKLEEPASAKAADPPANLQNLSQITEKAAAKHQEGLSVRVETLQTGQSRIDPKQIKLLAPFPAKPLSQPPAGWHLEASESAPPFIREVEVAPGSKVTLTIRPHFLVPDADGSSVFTISEPGYQSSLGYQQTETVGALLANSLNQLEKETIQLGNAIEGLQQLLISLPKTELEPPVNRPATPPKK